MSTSTLDIRTVDNELSIRDGTDSQMVIEGYALVFNQPSQPMPFIEYIEPNALDGVDLSNVLLLSSHKYENILARTDSDSLTLKVDAKGLFFSAVLPDTTLGHDTYQNILLGNIKGCSFGFIIGEEDWSLDDNGNTIHTIQTIKEVKEISVTSLPAYTETSVAVKRSLEEFQTNQQGGNDKNMNELDSIKQALKALETAVEQVTDATTQAPEAKPTEPVKAPSEPDKEPSPVTDATTKDPSEPVKRAEDDYQEDDATPKAPTAPVAEPSTTTSTTTVAPVAPKPATAPKEPQQLSAENAEDTNKKDDKKMAKELQRKEDVEARSFEKYVRSHGEVREGVTTANTEAVIPTTILTEVKEALAPNMLKQYVNRQTVSAPSGTLPIVKKASAGLVTKEELAENPEIGMAIVGAPFSVKSYAGALPISQEMLDDSAVDINRIAGEYVSDVSAITEQRLIGTVLQSAKAKKEIKTADDLKDAFNLDIPTGYNKSFVLSQSMFNFIDKLKDAQGRYLFQDSITSASGKVLLGAPVYVVDDNILGGSNGFVGDLKAFVLDAVKKEVTVKWQDNDLYASKLATYLRLDVVKAIEEAGEFLSMEDSATTTTTTVAPKN